MWYAKAMKNKITRMKNFIVFVGLSSVLFFGFSQSLPFVTADKITDMEGKIKDTQNKIDNIGERIDTLSDEQDLIEEKIDDLNAEIVNMLTSISMKEEEIAEKELQIVDKQAQINLTEQEYYAAKEREEQQYADMTLRLRSMYERGDAALFSMLLKGQGLGDLLNQMDYVERIYAYDRVKLEEFRETKNQVHDLWDQLVMEKDGLVTDKTQLEADKEVLNQQKMNLNKMLDQKKKESANYEAEIKKAKREAEEAKKLLKKEQNELKKLKEEANRGENSKAAQMTYATTNYTSVIDGASGSDLGKKIAKYGCQYIGNKYVYGGTDLNKGADCSGFTYRIYSDFGYKIPRTSFEQRSAGTGIDYASAQPGDLICYDGHVGMYIGGGMIVHASSAKTGIKVSKADYRTILTVRRII